ncbi:MAG: MFS transporter [bacterium]
MISTEKPRKTTPHGYTASEVRSSMWYVLVAWMFGSVFAAITSAGPYAAFLDKYLHANDATFGLLMALPPSAVIFFIIGSYIVERTGRAKPIFLVLVTIHRLLWLVIAAVPMFMHDLPRNTQVYLVGSIAFLSLVLATLGGAGWAAWMASIIPKSLAGRYFGLRAAYSLICMIVSTMTATWLIDKYHGSREIFAIVFAVGAILGAIDILIFIKVPEVPRPVVEKTKLIDIVTIPWKNKMFRRFMLLMMPTFFAYTLTGPCLWKLCFATLANHGLGFNNTYASFVLTIIPWCGMAVTSAYWGKLVDRFGPRPVIALGLITQLIVPIAWAFIIPEYKWFFILPATIIGGLMWQSIEQSNTFIAMKVFPEERRSAYMASMNVFIGIAGTLGAAASGKLAEIFEPNMHYFSFMPSYFTHYHMVILLSVFIRFISYASFFKSSEIPGKVNISQAIKMIIEDLTGNRRKREE